MNRSFFKYVLVGTSRLMQYITGTEGPDTAFQVHGRKSEGERRNYGTFCLTRPEENYWLLCMVVSGISCSAVIKIQLLVAAGTQMPF